jgi:hypothetical protein
MRDTPMSKICDAHYQRMLLMATTVSCVFDQGLLLVLLKEIYVA